jgi:UDP-2-acetamido-3-amino-2,3-dideoxy-glucuronate N-acetyltransferase
MSEHFFQHENAIVETDAIGEGTRIWAFAHILGGARIGRDCTLSDHTYVENDVIVGDRVTVKSGVQLCDGVRLENDVFVGPNASFTNDVFPRGKQNTGAGETAKTTVKRGASIGANATILAGITIGERARVGAGSVVTQNVPPDSVVAGNPAKITGYVGVPSNLKNVPAASTEAGSDATEVKGVTMYTLPRVDDMRGALTFTEVETGIPFEIKRFFLVYDVPSSEIRGEHAHRTQHQFLICVHGSCCVLADDGTNRREFWLDAPSRGLHLAPLTWSVQYRHTQDAVLLVLASDVYDPSDYIREYDEFLSLIGARIETAFGEHS